MNLTTQSFKKCCFGSYFCCCFLYLLVTFFYPFHGREKKEFHFHFDFRRIFRKACSDLFMK